jgi:ParB family chromosome partitioning protein
MAKKGLGRGLESLIPKKPKKITTKEKNEMGIVELDINKIIPNPEQPRKDMDQGLLQELAQSIKEHGIIQPLVVAKNKQGKYEVLAGERRLRAAKIANLKKVPVVVRTASDQQKLEVAIVENVQRQDLNPVEEANSYERLINEFNLNQEQIAKKVGKSRPTIANILRVLSLPGKIMNALAENKITMGHAKIIMGLKTESEQLYALEEILQGDLSVKETGKNIIKPVLKNKTLKIKNPRIISFEETLRQSLGTKVEINNRGKKGKIVINYYSDSELGDIVDKISEG